MKNCVRCGDEIDKGLWCKDCVGYVDDELNGGRERSLLFYFRRYKQNAYRKPKRVREEA